MPRALTSTTKMDRVVGSLNLLVKKNKSKQPNIPLFQLWSGDDIPGDGRGSLAAYFQHWQVAVGLGPCQAWVGSARGALTGSWGSLVLGQHVVGHGRWDLAWPWTRVTVSPLLSLVISF